jgi:hypothetical protein
VLLAFNTFAAKSFTAWIAAGAWMEYRMTNSTGFIAISAVIFQ